MMLGYGLVNSLSQLVVRPIADRLTASSRQQEMLDQMERKHTLDLEAVRLNKRIERDIQIQIQSYCHKLRRQEAKDQFENQLEMWRIGNFNSQVWPLRTPFDHSSLHPNFGNGQPIPVNVFLAQTDPGSPFSSLIQPDLKNMLSTFLQTKYVISKQHPCICRIGDWKAGFQDAAFINALWFGMQGQPSIVINPIQSALGETLDLNVSAWGLGENGNAPTTQQVLTGSFASAIGKIERELTLDWKNKGLLMNQSPQMTHNLNLLAHEERMIAEGNGNYVGQLLTQYQLPQEIRTEVITKFSREYNHLVSCVTGMYADIYHLIEYGAQPYMPEAIKINNENTGNHFQIPKIAINYYRKTLVNMVCTDYLQDKLPNAFLGVAKSLSYSPNDSMQIFQEGVGLWANKKLELNREIPIPENIDDCLRLLKDNASDNDRQYLEMARDTLKSMALEDAANTLKKRIDVLVDSPQFDEWSVNVETTKSFTDVSFAKWITNNKALAMNASYAIMAFRETYFVMLFLTDKARVVKNIPGQCIIAERYYFKEGTIEDNFSVYDMKRNQYISKSILMDKKEFHSFENLGRQIDTFITNIGSMSRPRRVAKADNLVQNDFSQRVTRIFDSGNFSSLETEQCDTAEFASIEQWVISKFPIVRNAVKAHVFKTEIGGSIMLCIFFEDKEGNPLIKDNYPMKRIICNKCDSDIVVFLNGLTIGTFNNL